VGSAGEPADRHGARIVAHRLEAPVIRGEVPVPEPVLLEWEKPLYEHGLTLPPAPPTRVDTEADDGEPLGFGDGAVAVRVPGHTDGSIAVHPPRHGVLFTGDTVARADRIMPGVFDTDRERTIASMSAPAAPAPSVVCFGHGEPVTEGAAGLLGEAAAEAVRAG
jgi:glyoxylase-like metal-dependent hydrolase (beta-lactamase superfamily II)